MTDININSEQNTEDKILAAAEAEFIAKGFTGARTMAIAQAAGVTHAMLHYYFRTKEKLFEKIIDGKTDVLSSLVLGALDAPGKTLFEKIETAVCAHFDIIAANPNLPRFFIYEIYTDPRHMGRVIARLKEKVHDSVITLQKQIEEAADAGICRRLDAAGLILDIVSLNIFPFLAAPMANALLGGMLDDTAKFIALRKKENVETILRKLKP